MGRGKTNKVGNSNSVSSIAASNEIPNNYRLPAGDDARTYFAYGSYQNNYTIEDFVRDSRNVSLYSGIDFERSGSAYSEQGRIYAESRKRWQKQIQYNREYNNGRRNLTEVSINKLKTMYNNSTSEDIRRRIAAELNVRGIYRNNGKWKNRGGGR